MSLWPSQLDQGRQLDGDASKLILLEVAALPSQLTGLPRSQLPVGGTHGKINAEIFLLYACF